MNSLSIFEGDKLATVEGAAMRLCKSSLVPQTFRNKPAETFSAIMLGYSLGLDPMSSLLEINVIQGRPSISTKLMIALVKKKYKKCKFKWDRTKTDSVGLTLTLDENCEGFSTKWDIGRASKMNLMNRDQYKKQLTTMLSWRCASEAIRFMAPDAVLGLYSDDEALDLPDEIEDNDVERLWREGKTEAELTLGDPEYIYPTRKFANKKNKEISIEELEKRYDYLEKRTSKDGYVFNQSDFDEKQSISIYMESVE